MNSARSLNGRRVRCALGENNAWSRVRKPVTSRPTLSHAKSSARNQQPRLRQFSARHSSEGAAQYIAANVAGNHRLARGGTASSILTRPFLISYFLRQTISPASAITGDISLPGDKSISHRYAMISAIAQGATRIANYSTGADCHSTLGCVRALGIEVEGAGTEFVIRGKGLDGLRQPAAALDAGNSGSTIRMLSGILAAQPFHTRIFGDESLSRRPMQRIMQPLAEMGARIQAHEDRFPPLAIDGVKLRPISYTLPVPSAQVKTCVLFAGLFAEGTTSITESVPSRDHSEIALREFGADLTVVQRKISLDGR